MSEIKVNKISPRTACGTTTLGDSGDTFTIPAGVSITNNGTASGFGATGSASWNTTVKTGDFTAVAGEGYFVNTTGGEIDVALPAGTAGAVVAVKDYANTFDTQNCILVPNGSDKIGGIANSATLSTEGLAVTLIFIDSTQGWLVTDDGLQSVADADPFIAATGGTITNTPTCRIHTFTGPGTFTVSKIAQCAANNVVSHMIVGGGGGGAGGSNSEGGGGGGAGGYREVKSPVTSYTASPLDGYPSAPNRITVTVQAYPIVVGGGGPGGSGGAPCGPDENGTQGVNSSFGGITAAGGGFGGRGNNPGQCAGGPGGSGGGGGAYSNPGGTGNTPPVSPAQGNTGGTGYSGSPGYAAGAGGGAGAVGGNGAAPQAGAGGTGTTSSINGTPTARAGGGGGGAHPGGTGGAGGSGGGGQASNGPSATAGTINTGGGGGGNGGAGNGAQGGSGIVIIRYKIA